MVLRSSAISATVAVRSEDWSLWVGLELVTFRGGDGVCHTLDAPFEKVLGAAPWLVLDDMLVDWLGVNEDCVRWGQWSL